MAKGSGTSSEPSLSLGLSSESMRVGVIGLGAVGRELAIRLAAGTSALSVYDIDPDVIQSMQADGWSFANSPCDLARTCNCIVLSLPSPQAVREVMTGFNGILAGAAADSIVLDTSTIGPDTSREMAAAAAAANIGYLDAPVTCAVTSGGGVAAARCGELTFLVGGEAQHLERVQPLLATLGRTIHHLGESGAGSTMKLITNHISGVATLAVAEGLALATAVGFEASRTLEVCRDTVASSYVLSEVVQARLGGIAGPASFSIDLMHKDHALAAALGETLGVALPLNNLVRELCAQMSADGYGQRDNVSAVEWFAGQSGNTNS